MPLSMSVSISYHALFQPYLYYLQNTVNIYFLNANRQLMYTNDTFGIIINDVLLSSITMPYNAPDYGNEPSFYIDMTATGPDIN